MIGYLRGVLVDKHPPSLLIDVRGVGYEVEAPLSAFADLPDVGVEVRLFTHLAVREDAHTLYGFQNTAERSLFRNLIRVNGVGAKLALTILSGFNAAEFARCVEDADTASLTRLPGIGQKTAQRLVIEMRDRLPEGVSAGAAPSAEGNRGALGGRIEDAVHALVSLGYKAPDASRMVRSVDAADLSSEELIRAALRAVVR